MASSLRSVIAAQRLDFEINIYVSKRTFTTLENIDGRVSITAPVDTSFSNLEIQFLGTSRSYVENLTTAMRALGKSHAFHIFLKLSQAGLQALFPQNCIMSAGETYDFPFRVVNPQQLLPQTCQHRVCDPTVRSAHLQLPPTLGDKELTTSLGTPDDFSPDNASTRYGVYARLLRCGA